MKIVKSIKQFRLLIKDVRETVEIKAKEQIEGFLGILAATLDCSVLGNMLTGKGVMRPGEEITRAGLDFKCRLIF